MENNWEPYIGQKVVCLKTSGVHMGCQVFKDRIYTVQNTWKCPNCGDVKIFIRELVLNDIPEKACCVSASMVPNTINPMASSRYFAPVNPAYADCTSEIAKQFKEHPDTVDVPVKVLESN